MSLTSLSARTLPLVFALSVAIIDLANAQSAAPKSEIVTFFSEAVKCNARLFTPNGHGESSRAAAVVVAPGERTTRASVERYAEAIAARGMVALAIDYRGFGDCGGFLYFGEPVRWDDRLRFSQMTANMRIRRGRLDPKAQVIDIRNAMTYLQGVPGVDRSRIGLWGTDLSGGHAITVAGSDARIKAIVAQGPVIAGKDAPRTAFKPTAEQQAMMVKLARNGAPPANERNARSMNDDEARLALAEYRPYWYLDQIPQTASVLFVLAEDDKGVNDNVNAIVASKTIKGATAVKIIGGAKSSPTGMEDEAASAAAQWFESHL